VDLAYVASEFLLVKGSVTQRAVDFFQWAVLRVLVNTEVALADEDAAARWALEKLAKTSVVLLQ